MTAREGAYHWYYLWRFCLRRFRSAAPSGIRHPQVIYLGGDRIFQAPETGQDVGYGTLSEFGRQIASMRRIEVPQQVALG